MVRLRLPAAYALALLLATGCNDNSLSMFPGNNPPAMPDDDDDDGDDDDAADDDDDGAPYDDGQPPGDEAVGNVVTILLTTNNVWMDPDVSAALILNSVRWVAPNGVEAPSVLVIRDDEHSDEHPEDSQHFVDVLLDAGLEAVLVDEPGDGIEPSWLAGYHVAVLSNPGHSPDDPETLEALWGFSSAGFGIIFQGDDMAHFDGDDFDMEELTRLDYVDNGTSYGGHDVDNDDGDRYEVRLIDDHPVVDGIGGVTFFYGDDIDTTEATSPGDEVLAWCTVEGTDLPLKPAITA